MGKSNNRSSKPRLSKYEAPKQRRISKEQIQNATYKDVKLLEKFLSDRGKIRSSLITGCLLYTSPSPRDRTRSRMPSSA